jgi:hypothetical protein
VTQFLKHGRFRQNLRLLQEKSATAHTAEIRREKNYVFMKCDVSLGVERNCFSTLFKLGKIKAKLTAIH